MRFDFAHEVDAEIVFNAATIYAPQMADCIKQIIKDVEVSDDF